MTKHFKNYFFIALTTGNMAFKSRIDPLTNRSRYTIAFRSQMSHVAPDIPIKKEKRKKICGRGLIGFITLAINMHIFTLEFWSESCR